MTMLRVNELFTGIFTFQSGYIQMALFFSARKEKEHFTFQSGYIQIPTDIKVTIILYIPIWLYSNRAYKALNSYLN